jgi:hypothetical protein
MLSAIELTCAELTGSGSDATAASKAIFMMLMVSGGKDAFESLSSQVNLRAMGSWPAIVGAVCCDSTCRTKFLGGNWFIKDGQKAEVKG